MIGLSFFAAFASLAFASSPAPFTPSPRVEAVVGAVEPARLQASVAKLVSFGTRHTLSDTKSPVRGIGAARTWLLSEFETLSKLPGSRLQPFEDRFTAEPGPRIPKPVEIVNVGAILPGTDANREKEAIVLAGHYDSRATDVMDATGDAPGAVDDGSGTVAIIELARVLAREKLAVSVWFVAVAGEEQGLVGSAHLAKRLAAEGVRPIAMIALDTIGNVEGQDGARDDASARVFSEGVNVANETESSRKLREALGGENDGAAREWARYVERVGERYVPTLDLWVMLRQDRIARGGDHSAFTKLGFPGIRITETRENYDRQHQLPRTEGKKRYGDDVAHFDARYCAAITRSVAAAVATLAAAPAAPADVHLSGAVSADSRLEVATPDDARIAGLVLYRRRADHVAWERADRFPRGAPIVLPGVVPDNFTFAVATVDAEGNESVPVYPTRLR